MSCILRAGRNAPPPPDTPTHHTASWEALLLVMDNRPCPDLRAVVRAARDDRVRVFAEWVRRWLVLCVLAERAFFFGAAGVGGE